MTFLEKGLAAIAGVFVLLATGLGIAFAHQRDQKLQAAFRADSALAVLDTTRRLFDRRIQDAVGESTTVVTRRVVQAQVANSDLLAQRLKELYGQLQVVRADIKATITSNRGAGTSTVVAGPDSAQRATFHLYLQPYTLDAAVTAHKPPKKWDIEAQISSDPAKIGLRLTCGQATNGVRRADVVLTGPTWLALVADTIQQDPSICNSKAVDRLAAGLKPWWKPQWSIFTGGGYDPLDRKVVPVLGAGLAWTF